jgi:hypothetical protein
VRRVSSSWNARAGPEGRADRRTCDRPVPEPSLDCPGVVALIGEGQEDHGRVPVPVSVGLVGLLPRSDAGVAYVRDADLFRDHAGTGLLRSRRAVIMSLQARATGVGDDGRTNLPTPKPRR